MLRCAGFRSHQAWQRCCAIAQQSQIGIIQQPFHCLNGPLDLTIALWKSWTVCSVVKLMCLQTTQIPAMTIEDPYHFGQFLVFHVEKTQTWVL